MLKKMRVRPIKGFVRPHGTFLSSAQAIRHKCRNSSGTHFAEPLQMLNPHIRSYPSFRLDRILT